MLKDDGRLRLPRSFCWYLRLVDTEFDLSKDMSAQFLCVRVHFGKQGVIQMRMVLAGFLSVAIVMSVAPALAAKGKCAGQPSLQACIDCSANSPERRPEWTYDGMRRWCQANMKSRSEKKRAAVLSGFNTCEAEVLSPLP
jgi:hypothetical protein